MVDPRHAPEWGYCRLCGEPIVEPHEKDPESFPDLPYCPNPDCSETVPPDLRPKSDAGRPPLSLSRPWAVLTALAVGVTVATLGGYLIAEAVVNAFSTAPGLTAALSVAFFVVALNVVLMLQA